MRLGCGESGTAYRNSQEGPQTPITKEISSGLKK